MVKNNLNIKNNESNKLLIIVDPQNDFINGSLAVEGADKCMDALTKHVKCNTYNNIIVTLDWHPSTHCSFIDNGGEWPAHCVQYTVGSSIYEPLSNELKKLSNVEYLTKGSDKSIEEYSFITSPFKNTYFNIKCKCWSVDEIYVCGIMGRVCVLNTIKDMMDKHKEKITVLLDYTADDDKNQTLIKFCDDNNIKYKIV